MSSVSKALANAVVADLNEATFSLPFTATRVDEQINDLTDLNVLHVSVMTGKRTIKLGARGGRKSHEYRVDVAVQFKFESGKATADYDPYLQLAEEMADYYGPPEHITPPTYEQAVWFESEHLFLMVDEHWQRRLFTSVLSYHLRIV